MKGVLLAFGIVLCLWAGYCARAHAHDPYTEWKDSRGYSCCNNADCSPVRADRDGAGRWWVWMHGRKVLVPRDALLPIPSPDGRSHACMTPSALEPRCFVPGEVRG